MTGSPHHFPPPGAPLPDEAPPGQPGARQPASSYPAPPPSRGPAPPPGMLGAAHKPGAIALRPLGLGDMYDGAFRIIRFNPKATVGAAALVTAVAMVLPIAVNVVLALTVGSGLDTSGELGDEPSTAETLGFLGGLGSLLLGSYAAQLGLIFVTGMIVHVTRAAAVGRRLTLSEAWGATRGKRWRLLGQTLVVGLASLFMIVLVVLLIVLVAVASGDVLTTVLVGLAVVAAAVPLSVWLWVKLVLLATPALMLEPIGVFDAFGRTWQLTRGQFWRVFGIALLTVLITGTAGQILGVPFGFVAAIGGAIAPEYYFLTYSVATGIGAVLSNAFVAPFTAAVTSLQYIDQRMRKEAYDVELMREAGLIPR